MLNIVDEFNKQSGFTHAFLTTYEFSPGFFEDRILKTKAFRNCPNIAIFIDEDKYKEICTDPRGGRFINRRYMLIPVKMPNSGFGVFHPKQWLLFGKDIAKLYVGSSNLTRSGLTSNLEMISCFEHENSAADSPNLALFYSAYMFIRTLAEGNCDYSQTIVNLVRQVGLLYPFLAEKADSKGEIKLIHNLDSPILSQFLDMQKFKSSKVTILSPYFDSKIDRILNLISKSMKIQEVELIVQQNTNTLDVKSLKKWHSKAKSSLSTRLVCVPGRKLHAKILIIESLKDKSISALVGSANFTNAALVKNCQGGSNIELCLATTGASAKAVRTALKSKDIVTKKVRLEDILPMESKASEPIIVNNDIRLYHAEVDQERNLITTKCDIDKALTASDLEYNLLVRKLGSIDPDTICSLKKINANRGILDFELDSADASILNAATTVAIHAGHRGKELMSNYVWLLNIIEIHESANKNNRKIEKQFAESGKGLVDFINGYIEQGMIDKAIDILARVRIKFQNGAGGVHIRPTLRSSHSPITDDDVPKSLWGLTSDQKTVFGCKFYDFLEWHFDKNLKRHLAKPNLNGIPNFLDVLETCADMAMTILREGVLLKSEIYPRLLSGFQLFSGNSLHQGYFRELWCKYFSIQSKLKEVLHKHRVPARIITYYLILKSLEPSKGAQRSDFITLDDILGPTSNNYISRFIEFVDIDDGICKRVDDIFSDCYDNSDFCKFRFDNSKKEDLSAWGNRKHGA